MAKQPLAYDSRDRYYHGVDSSGKRIVIHSDAFAEARQQRERDGMGFDHAFAETADPDGWTSDMVGWIQAPETRGGKRPGAGRKPVAADQRKVQRTMQLTAATVRALERMAHPGERFGETIDRLVVEWLPANLD